MGFMIGQGYSRVACAAREACVGVLDRGQYCLGRVDDRLEREVWVYLGIRYAVAVNLVGPDPFLCREFFGDES